MNVFVVVVVRGRGSCRRMNDCTLIWSDVLFYFTLGVLLRFIRLVYFYFYLCYFKLLNCLVFYLDFVWTRKEKKSFLFYALMNNKVLLKKLDWKIKLLQLPPVNTYKSHTKQIVHDLYNVSSKHTIFKLRWTKSKNYNLQIMFLTHTRDLETKSRSSNLVWIARPQER